MKILSELFIFLLKVFSRAECLLKVRLFKRCGCNVNIGRGGVFSFNFIELGDDIYVGPGAVFLSDPALIKIGSKVMFGPNVTILAGNHRTDIVGRYMYDIQILDKLPENDKGVVVADDVWVGANVTILDGVAIGRGAIIGAGSVVSKSVPPYAIVCGVPARVKRYRWDLRTTLLHELSLYPSESRFSFSDLEKAFTLYE